MKKAQPAAALGLAALVLASPLAGATSAVASPAPRPVQSSASKTTRAASEPLVFRDGSGRYWSGNVNRLASYATLAAALAAPDVVRAQLPASGTAGSIVNDAGRCLALRTPGGNLLLPDWALTFQDCSTPWPKTFSVTADGSLVNPSAPNAGIRLAGWTDATGSSWTSAALTPDSPPGLHLVRFTAAVDSVDVFDRTAAVSGHAQPNGTVVAQGREFAVDAQGQWHGTLRDLKTGDNTVTLEQYDAAGNRVDGDHRLVVTVATSPLVARLDSTNASEGTAQVSGTATPGGVVVVGGTTTEFDVDRSGHWAGRVSNLRLGSNAVTFQQYVDGQKLVGDRTLDITIAAGRLTVTHEFSADAGERVLFSGRAEPYATVVITDSRGHATTTTASGTGSWQTRVDAPGGGEQTFRVVQKVAGSSSAPVSELVDYGRTLTVTAPADGAVVPGTSTTFSGTGARGVEVEIYEGTKKVGGATPIVTGAWEARVDGITPGEHVYTVVQLTKGDLTTSRSVTVNPGQSALDPVRLTNLHDGDSFVVGGVTRLEGTAEKNGTVTVRQGSTQLGTTAVDGAGRWSFDARITGTVDTTLSLSQTGSDAVTTVRLVAPAAPAFRPLAVTSGHFFSGSAVTTITGTATPRARIDVTIFGVTTSVQADSAGRWSFNRGFNNTVTYSIDFTQVAGDRMDSIRGWALGPNVAPLTIDNPSGSAFNVGGITRISGTASPRTAVTLRQNGAVLDTVQSGPDGRWVADVRVTGTSTATVTVTQAGAAAVTSVHLVAASFRPLTITSGHTFPGTALTTITGTATPYARVTVSVFGVGSTVAADAAGHWAFARGFNNALTYRIDVTQVATGGGTDTISGWVLGPRP